MSQMYRRRSHVIHRVHDLNDNDDTHSITSSQTTEHLSHSSLCGSNIDSDDSPFIIRRNFRNIEHRNQIYPVLGQISPIPYENTGFQTPPTSPISTIIAPTITPRNESTNFHANNAVDTDSKVDINNTSEAELMTIDGIGRARARAILNAQPFNCLSDIINIKYIGIGLLNKWKHSLVCYPPKDENSKRIKKLNVNKCSKKYLMSIDNIGEVLAERIIQGREYKCIKDLLKVKHIGPKRFESLEMHLFC